MLLVLSVMFGVFLFLDVLFLRGQHLVAVIIAVVAVTLAVLTMTSLGMAIKAGFSLTGPAGALLSSSMITAAYAASLPHPLTAPIGVSGRYHNVASDLVPHASIVEQGKALMLIYDTDVVFHLMLQAIGTIVVGAAMLWSLPAASRLSHMHPPRRGYASFPEGGPS